ncbi:hypothetical protein OFY17_12575 [Marinomonas sp. C2222]|uniref:Uncharacterized protein n=1 Tax=Marinomonas sargassi TaxID=2984494 RepID=A0ABT2YUY8_9GAMM|nr:hypothetical protein [Marinomonas sargassi]MCV2403707.1 hypothetical protein [Marinomonas sargassi]
MKKTKVPVIAAICSAILIHLLIIHTAIKQGWFITESKPATFKLVLLPETNITADDISNSDDGSVDTYSQREESASSSDAQADTVQTNAPSISTEHQPLEHQENPNFSADINTNAEELSLSDTFDIDNQASENQTFNNELPSTEQSEPFLSEMLNNSAITDKPELLDLSNIEIPIDNSDAALSGVFSEELRNKIEKSKAAQAEYLKGQVEITDYPITEGADGVRYVNIEGVCWKIPELGSDEPWSIVLSGCAELNKSFHFELNIAPNTLLGPESPFFIGQ